MARCSNDGAECCPSTRQLRFVQDYSGPEPRSPHSRSIAPGAIAVSFSVPLHLIPSERAGGSTLRGCWVGGWASVTAPNSLHPFGRSASRWCQALGMQQEEGRERPYPHRPSNEDARK